MYGYFNPRSLAGATRDKVKAEKKLIISIHAPSRERRICSQFCRHYGDFNPRSLAGATKNPSQCRELLPDFNPRSLAGATWRQKQRIVWERISIHAPSRERRLCDDIFAVKHAISIHAPSRERHSRSRRCRCTAQFQSTLPRGSDLRC